METAQSASSVNQLDDAAQGARWEDRLSDLARVESILKKRKAELQEMDTVLMERSRRLDDVAHKRKIAEGHLRRAQEDAGIIEQRAAETSVELIRAGNQLINLEMKGKALNERHSQVNKTLEAKSRELKQVENSCEVVRQNVDKLNKELGSKMEELESKENELKDVESRIQLSLRVEELRQLMTQTETEEKNQAEKYVRALKEGEKALEEKTVQLARTRNEIQTQTTKFHELNSKINKLRNELQEVQVNIRKEKSEANKLAEKREEERRIHELQMKKAGEKLVEINNARNESMDALKSHREEFALLRRKIHESMNKMKECEELKKEKEAEYKKALSTMNEDKAKLEKELSRLRSETREAEQSFVQVNADLYRVTNELKTVTEKLQTSEITNASLTEELNNLQQTITEKGDELRKTTQEIEGASKELERVKENIAEIQARHDEMVADMKEECQKSENPRIDGLPQESSTPTKNEKDDEALISSLQESIKQLTIANEEKHASLEYAKAEVRELKEVMESERKNFKEYMVQNASESAVYRKHIERLQMEYTAEKQRTSQEKDLLLHEVEEYRLKARKLSEELSALKQNHLQTIHELNKLRDTLAKDVKELKEHIQGITTQMKSELSRSLKQVESSKEQTSDEIEHLREKDNEIEKQLAAMQQSINTAKQMALIAEKEKAMISKREKEEALVKQQGVKLQRQQTYLRAQIRQQMSTRAEALDEERKKAEVSLEGLKSKLKNLEEVITRKDSTVEDFRLKLLRSKVEAEKAADSNKQIDELKRRLRELEDEKDLIKIQRNHLAALSEGVSFDSGTVDSRHFVGDVTGGKMKTPSTRLRRSLDSLIDDSFYTKPIKLELELPCRDDVTINTSLPLQVHHSAQLHSEHDRNFARSMTASFDASKLSAKREMDHGVGQHLPAHTGSESGRKLSFEPYNTTLEHSIGQNSVNVSNSSSRMFTKQLSTDNGFKVATHSTNPEQSQTEKSLLTVSGLSSYPREVVEEDDEKLWPMEQVASRPSQGSASSFADDRRSEFLSSVYRLKNEKVRELELSLQRFFLT